jgi:hypothetical protein
MTCWTCRRAAQNRGLPQSEAVRPEGAEDPARCGRFRAREPLHGPLVGDDPRLVAVFPRDRAQDECVDVRSDRRRGRGLHRHHEALLRRNERLVGQAQTVAIGRLWPRGTRPSRIPARGCWQTCWQVPASGAGEGVSVPRIGGDVYCQLYCQRWGLRGIWGDRRSEGNQQDTDS